MLNFEAWFYIRFQCGDDVIPSEFPERTARCVTIKELVVADDDCDESYATHIWEFSSVTPREIPQFPGGFEGYVFDAPDGQIMGVYVVFEMSFTEARLLAYNLRKDGWDVDLMPNPTESNRWMVRNDKMVLVDRELIEEAIELCKDGPSGYRDVAEQLRHACGVS